MTRIQRLLPSYGSYAVAIIACEQAFGRAGNYFLLFFSPNRGAVHRLWLLWRAKWDAREHASKHSSPFACGFRVNSRNSPIARSICVKFICTFFQPVGILLMEEAGWRVQTARYTSFMDNFTKKFTLTRTEQTVPKRK